MAPNSIEHLLYIMKIMPKNPINIGEYDTKEENVCSQLNIHMYTQVLYCEPTIIEIYSGNFSILYIHCCSFMCPDTDHISSREKWLYQIQLESRNLAGSAKTYN